MLTYRKCTERLNGVENKLGVSISLHIFDGKGGRVILGVFLPGTSFRFNAISVIFHSSSAS